MVGGNAGLRDSRKKPAVHQKGDRALTGVHSDQTYQKKHRRVELWLLEKKPRYEDGLGKNEKENGLWKAWVQHHVSM